IFDAMLVIAGAAALALRGASWWARCYAWASLLILLAALAIGNALHATGTTLPAQPTKAAVAVIPWVLLLMAFGLLLEMLRHFRTTRSAAAKAAAAGAASASSGVGVNGERAAVTQAASSGGKLRELPRVDLDTLLGPRGGQPPPIEITHDTGAGENADHQADPVSYGEETGYVHPDSYLAEGEYSPHGDTGGAWGRHRAGRRAGRGGPVTRMGRPVTRPGRPVTTPGRPVTTPGRPVTTPGRPVTTPGRPVTTPGRPVTTPGRPVTTPGRPVASTGRPVTR